MASFPLLPIYPYRAPFHLYYLLSLAVFSRSISSSLRLVHPSRSSLPLYSSPSPHHSILSHSSPHHHRPFLIVPPNHRETTTFTNMHRQMQSPAAPFSVLTPTVPLHLLSILPSCPPSSPPLTPFLLSPLFRHSLLPSPLHPAALPPLPCLSHSPSPSSPSPLLRGVFCATTCSR